MQRQGDSQELETRKRRLNVGCSCVQIGAKPRYRWPLESGLTHRILSSDCQCTLCHGTGMTREQRLRKLRKHIGDYATKRLREGKAALHCWRGSSPHNWYVESFNRVGTYLWHSDGWGDVPDRRMFVLLEDSKDHISHHWIHSDGGKPFKSTYVLKPEFLL